MSAVLKKIAVEVAVSVAVIAVQAVIARYLAKA